MKKRLLLSASVLLATFVWAGVTLSASAQEDKLSGKWVGTETYDSGGKGFDVTLKFQKSGNAYEGLYNKAEMSNISFDGKNIGFTIPAGNATSQFTSRCQGRVTIDQMNVTCDIGMKIHAEKQ